MVREGAVPRRGSWNSRPMTRLRLWLGVKVTSSPPRVMEPESTKKLPATALSRVDLPAPLEPMMVAKSPGARWRDR